jgi:DNA-binding transcriptional MocR family regulator
MAESQDELFRLTQSGSWTPSLSGRAGPRYQALADSIAEAVRDGTLAAGDRLAPHRVMARRLGFDLATVTRAYAEGQRAGLLEATVGRGTFVRTDAPMVQQRGLKHAAIDLSMNLPPFPINSALQTMLQQGLTRLLRENDLGTLMTYHWDTGNSEERRAGAAWLKPCLGRIEPQRVLVCPGAQSAMLTVLTCLARPGEVVLCESLTYPGIRGLAAQLGITLAGVATDSEGFLPEELERACHEMQPRLIYCTPTIQNPTTATMSLERRDAVTAIARAYQVPILEDDAYGLFPSIPMPALAQIAPDLVFYVATTAKSLSPGLRMAYLVAPGRVQTDRLSAGLRGMVQMSSGLLSGLVTRWIQSGEAASLLASVREESTIRQAMARMVLGTESIQAHPEGPHLWLQLPPSWRAAEFASYARRDGLAIVPSEIFRVDGPETNAVRLALGVARSREQLLVGLQGLREIMQRPIPAAFMQTL